MTWYLWFYVIEAVVIVTGNATVLVVFTRTPSLRRRKHYLLVSLAVADLLVGVIPLPMYLAIILFRQTESIIIIYTTMDVLFGTASVFGLTAVAIERVYAVYFPLKHRTLWKGVYMIGIAVTWIMATFPSFSHFYLNDGISWFCARSVPILVSLAVIIVSYFLIWIKMNCKTSVPGHAITKRDKRLTVTLLIVTFISLIAWIPIKVFRAYTYICRECPLFLDIQYAIFGMKFLHYGNSLVNPILYALRMPQFKRAVFNALQCRKEHQLAADVPNERVEPNRANLIPTTNYDKKATAINDFQCSGVRDEIQLNENPSTVQNSVRDGILKIVTSL